MTDVERPYDRRTLLAAAVGAAAATAVSALGQPAPTRAANNDPLLVGRTDNAASASTVLTVSAGSPGLEVYAYTGTAIRGQGDTAGLSGFAANGPGVIGGTAAGVGAEGIAWYDTTGVLGFSTSGGTGAIPAPPAKTGVYGYAAQGTTSRGVYGRTVAGRGVYGQATSGQGIRGYATSGVGVFAEAATGYALRTNGRVRHDSVSGVVTIPAGNSAWPVMPPGIDVSSGSFVLLTPRGNLGGRSLWYTIDTTANSFTIRVSSPVTTSLPVGWLLLG
jgi:hypothetical protein